MNVINVDRIIELRKSRGWTQRKLAKEAEIANTVISRLEAGTQKDIRLSNLVAVAEVLNVTVESLLISSSLETLESDLIPELQTAIWQLKEESETVQRQAAGIIRGYLNTLGKN